MWHAQYNGKVWCLTYLCDSCDWFDTFDMTQYVHLLASQSISLVFILVSISLLNNFEIALKRAISAVENI